MNNTLNRRDEAIRLLAQGYSTEFAETVAADERFHELLSDMATEFVEKNIPIVDEDASYDVSLELMMNVTARSV